MDLGVYTESLATAATLDGGSACRRGNTIVRVLTAEELSASDMAAWSDLEARAIEPNAYMSPHFVLPALRHLEPEAPVEIWFVQRHAGGTAQLIGACAFVSTTRAQAAIALGTTLQDAQTGYGLTFDAGRANAPLVATGVEHKSSRSRICRAPGWDVRRGDTAHCHPR